MSKGKVKYPSSFSNNLRRAFQYKNMVKQEVGKAIANESFEQKLQKELVKK